MDWIVMLKILLIVVLMLGAFLLYARWKNAKMAKKKAEAAEEAAAELEKRQWAAQAERERLARMYAAEEETLALKQAAAAEETRKAAETALTGDRATAPSSTEEVEVAMIETVADLHEALSGEPETTAVGTQILKEMKSRCLTQQATADLLGTSRSTLNRTISGARPLDAAMAEMLSAAFGRRPAYWQNLQKADDRKKIAAAASA